MKSTYKKNLTAAAFACALSLLVPMRAFAQPAPDEWTFSVMPYLWLPSMSGTLRYGPPSAGGAAPKVDVDAETLLGALDLAFMVTGEARKNRWLIATDVIDLRLSSDSSSITSIDFNPGSGPINVFNTALDTGTETQVKGTVWTLVGGYAAVQDPHVTLDVIGGLRYFGLKATTDWQLSATVAGPSGAQAFTRTGSVTSSEDIWDAIVGIRGRVKLGERNWFMPYTWMPAPGTPGSRGRACWASGMPSNGATSFSPTATCPTNRATTTWLRS